MSVFPALYQISLLKTSYKSIPFKSVTKVICLTFILLIDEYFAQLYTLHYISSKKISAVTDFQYHQYP